MPTFTLYCDSPALNEAVQRRIPAATAQPAAHLPPTPTEPFLHAAQTGSCWTVRGPAPAVALVGAATTAAGLHPRIDTSGTGATEPEMTVTAPDDPPGVLVDAIDSWWRAHDDRTVLLATPRSSCAGVDRAVQIVQLALQQFGPPIYVRKQIVHNEHFITQLRDQGAVFVDTLQDVPRGGTVVFSAHGVGPAVHAEAAERQLRVFDATCPLVAKVHNEVHTHTRKGRSIVYIGHSGHDETVGTLAQAPTVQLVETVRDVERLILDDTSPVAYLTQTTLAHDDVEPIVSALKQRWPHMTGPRGEDICYATTNRQNAVKKLAPQVQLILVVGSPTSSNAQRLVEVASRAGTAAVLINDAYDLDPVVLHGLNRVGVTASASTPESDVRGVLDALASLGRVDVDTVHSADEHLRFTIPAALR